MEEMYYTNDSKILLQIKPKFNFIYELGMPTGRKMKNALIMIFLFSLLVLFLEVYGSSLSIAEIQIIKGITIQKIINIVCYIFIVVAIAKFTFHLLFQIFQYKNISYEFFDDHMVYKDEFLNQHTKKIQYANVKEVEIRRSIWDRILGFGVIIIYTNAENEYSNGLVIYGIDNPKEAYEKIDTIVHIKRDSAEAKEVVNNVNKVAEIEKTAQKEVEIDEKVSDVDFKDSLKNIK